MENDNRLPLVIYSKPGCAQCNATYRWLKDHGIRFRVEDISENEQAAEFVRAMGHQQAPVVVVPFDYGEAGGRHWAGFRPDMLDALV
jgi:glutaredoxin-like protein NrdH